MVFPKALVANKFLFFSSNLSRYYRGTFVPIPQHLQTVILQIRGSDSAVEQFAPAAQVDRGPVPRAPRGDALPRPERE